MGTVEQLATAHPVEVLLSTPTKEAARFMSEYAIGDVLVTDDDSGEIVGILTDRDLTVRLVAHDLDPSTHVGQICSRNVTTLHVDENVPAAVSVMSDQAIHRLPIVDRDNKPVGILSIENLASSNDVRPHDIQEIMRACTEKYRHDRLGL